MFDISCITSRYRTSEGSKQLYRASYIASRKTWLLGTGQDVDKQAVDDDKTLGEVKFG